MPEGVHALGALFGIAGDLLEVKPLGSGHIHDTFVAAYGVGGDITRFVHQRLNTQIFAEPMAVCENIARVTEHVRSHLAARGVSDLERRCLQLIPARNASPCTVDREGAAWRTYRYVERTRALDVVDGPDRAREAARTFGAFVALLADLPGPPLVETLPGFHDLAARRRQLRDSARDDAAGRRGATATELERAASLWDRLDRDLGAAGFDALPRRTVHNDCKLNNILFDADSGEGLCVVDLDTVMDGQVAFDFGNLVRTSASLAPEDETDLDLITFDLDLFRALALGYCEGTAGVLTAEEREVLPLAGPMLAYENAIRFLADHLSGDVYFRIHREEHNLERARAQMRLCEAMLARLDDARRIVESVARQRR
ncbi:MAG: phosphotransferase enzyme family protein [Myxococcota bacterium]